LGNSKFLTRRLWGIANQHPFGHHGMYTTMREALLAHDGEARDSRAAFQSLCKYDQDSVIEFLKSLQIVPADVTRAAGIESRTSDRCRRITIP